MAATTPPRKLLLGPHLVRKLQLFTTQAVLEMNRVPPVHMLRPNPLNLSM